MGIQGDSKRMIRIYGMIGGFLTMVLTGALWSLDHRRQNSEKSSAGRLIIQAAGFGFLPAAAVWNAFKSYDGVLSKGTALISTLPAVPWLTQDGYYIPCRIDLAAALTAFIILCIWLICKRKDLIPAADLLLISVTVWAGIRMVTESFYETSMLTVNGHPVLRYAACAVVLVCLAGWSVRREKRQKNTLQLVIDWTGALLSAAAVVITSEKVLTTGSEIGDFALISGAALLMTGITLIVGADCRKGVS